MSTPLPRVNKRQIFIDADEAEQRRHLLDEHDTQRRIVLNLLCEQCEKQLVFTKCKTHADEAECIIELVSAAITANRGWNNRWADLEIHGSE
jgi:hypothetical protein